MELLASCNLCHADVDVGTKLAYRKDGIEVVRCPICGLVFRTPMPSLAELGEIYDQSYFQDDLARPNRQGYSDYRGDETAHRRNARERLQMIESLAPNKGALLDVGCAAGYFVAEALGRGWDARGVDIAHEIVGWGRRHVTDEISAGSFSDSQVPSNTFGAVTMWDYLEHSVDARADLEHARRILAPAGLVAISTGDIESLVARLSGKRWHLLTPRHHNYFFGRTTLRRMLSGVGFEVIRVTHASAWYGVGHLVYKLQTIASGRLSRTVSHRLRRTNLGRRVVPINLFDIVTVVARKPADTDRDVSVAPAVM